MNTDKRLDEAYNNAKVIEFDDESRFIFFSDVHRGDNSFSDEFAHNQSTYYHALRRYYKKEYTYIELGDGDELWEHANFSHIRSAHSDIYYLLNKMYRAGRLFMLYGNHNSNLKDKRFVKENFFTYYDDYLECQSELFPGIIIYESIILKHKVTGQEIFLVHGHQGDLMNDQLEWISMILVRYFWRFMHVVGFRNPASPAKNVLKQHKIERNFNKWNEKKQIVMICGHTHRPKFAGKDDLPYFNTGCCVHPRGITGIEIIDGKIMMIDWRVRPDKNGVLYIYRKIIRGPVALVDYIKHKTNNNAKTEIDLDENITDINNKAVEDVEIDESIEKDTDS